MPYADEDVLEVHGLKFLYDGEDLWFLERPDGAWTVLPDLPSYLVVVQGRLALIDFKTGRPKCNCPRFEVVSFGCKCGGV